MNKPVIAPRTRGILDYFAEDEMFYFEPGDAASLCSVLLEVYRCPDTVREKLEKGRAVYLRHTWKRERRRLVRLVQQTAGAGGLQAGSEPAERN
jgi:glycosyltransferase involved in cell wall biosynthesis